MGFFGGMARGFGFVFAALLLLGWIGLIGKSWWWLPGGLAIIGLFLFAGMQDAEWRLARKRAKADRNRAAPDAANLERDARLYASMAEATPPGEEQDALFQRAQRARMRASRARSAAASATVAPQFIDGSGGGMVDLGGKPLRLQARLMSLWGAGTRH